QKFYQHFGFSMTDQIMEDTTKFGTIRERVMVKQDP
ncbi:MAG: GNAT family N-acetyltransferase, partial [Lacticaseibacillus paracasei]|nr:GNAT family N-acetyltransferase [Lacticaseibacillus paracasei]